MFKVEVIVIIQQFLRVLKRFKTYFPLCSWLGREKPDLNGDHPFCET